MSGDCKFSNVFSETTGQVKDYSSDHFHTVLSLFSRNHIVCVIVPGVHLAGHVCVIVLLLAASCL